MYPAQATPSQMLPAIQNRRLLSLSAPYCGTIPIKPDPFRFNRLPCGQHGLAPHLLHQKLPPFSGQ